MTTINQLNATETVANDDLLMIWDTSAQSTRRITAQQMAVFTQQSQSVGVRRKYEAYWTGLSTALTAATEYNLVTLLKATAPSTGAAMSATPFVNTATDKIAVYNEDVTCFIKLTIEGTFTGGSSNRGLSMMLGLAVPDTLVYPRPITAPNDTFSFLQMVSVDKDGFAASNGFTLKIKPELGNYTINTVKLIVEQ